MILTPSFASKTKGSCVCIGSKLVCYHLLSKSSMFEQASPLIESDWEGKRKKKKEKGKKKKEKRKKKKGKRLKSWLTPTCCMVVGPIQ